MSMKRTQHANTSRKGLVPMAVTSCIGFALLTAAGLVQAQQSPYPITSQQRTLAQQVASRGIPVSELKPNAPARYTVKRGDTLWAISGMYLSKPWRWPELWGMNLSAIKNPHLIYPGQTLYLNVQDGYARLGLSADGGSRDQRLSPTIRSEQLDGAALPTIRRDVIEPFLAKPVIKNADELERLPVVLGSADQRIIMGKGDDIYVRGTENVPLSTRGDHPRDLAIFRDVKPLRDPETRKILAYEGEYLGKARVTADEHWVSEEDKKGKSVERYVPGKLTITEAVSEIRAGDRLNFFDEKTDYSNFIPHASPEDVTAKVVSIYAGTSINDASSNSVVSINAGADQGIESGHVFQVRKGGKLVRDPESRGNTRVRLPDEDNGYLLIFRVFDNVSYGLLLDTQDGVGVGDTLISPR